MGSMQTWSIPLSDARGRSRGGCFLSTLILSRADVKLGRCAVIFCHLLATFLFLVYNNGIFHDFFCKSEQGVKPMLQLAVCDDEAVCLRQTVDILRAALGDTPHQLKTFQNAPAVLHMLAEDGYRPDIAVLDICMGDMDGITLAKQINRLAPACRVIFLSSYAGYLMDAYEAEHIYYVLKSDEAARLPVALRKALGALSSEKMLTVRRGGSYQRVGVDTVLYLERSLHKMFVHTTDGDLETTQSPQALLEGDAAGEFIRCHQSFWVNCRAIAGMEHETFCLSDGTRVPISRSYRKNAREAFFRLLAGRTARLDVPEGAADGV